MYQLILIIHVILALSIITLVLIQHGKGADMGAAFGSGASNTVFGSQGTGGFLFKLTGGLAILFFITSVSLSAMISSHYKNAQMQMIPQQQTIPVNTPDNKIPVPDEAQKS